jgi:hypothetical protein
MQGRDYLRVIQEREYVRLGIKARDYSAFLGLNADRLAHELVKTQKARSPIEDSLTNDEAHLCFSGIDLINLPARFENPIAHSIVSRLTNEIECSAERIFGWQYKDKPTIGTLPLGQVNASLIRVPFTEQYIIVFQENLFTFVSLCAKVVAAAIPSNGSRKPASFSYALNEIDERISSNPVISRRFTDLLTSYLLAGRPHADGQYVLVQPNRTYSEILIQAAELFALGHEHAHAIKGHLTQSIREASNEPAVVDEIPFSWEQEFEADEVGVMLGIASMKRMGYDAGFGYSGADFFCSAMDIVEQAVGIFRPKILFRSRNRSHPPWSQRRAYIRQALSTGIGSDKAMIPLIVARSIEYILTSLWTKARQTLIASQHAGENLSPIWTGRFDR